jgi:hypothetical protein
MDRQPQAHEWLDASPHGRGVKRLGNGRGMTPNRDAGGAPDVRVRTREPSRPAELAHGGPSRVPNRYADGPSGRRTGTRVGDEPIP